MVRSSKHLAESVLSQNLEPADILKEALGSGNENRKPKKRRISRVQFFEDETSDNLVTKVVDEVESENMWPTEHKSPDSFVRVD